MRITYIHQHFRTPDEAGGGRPYEFARRLVQQKKATVTIICGGNRNARFTVADINVIQVRASYSNNMTFGRRLLAFLQFMFAASKAASSLDADVVLASSTPLTAAVPGIIAARLRRARFVLEIRDLWPTIPIRMGLLPKPFIPAALLLERVAYRSADEVIALSPWMGEGVRSINANVAITVIPNCADTGFSPATSREECRSRWGVAENELLLYYAGSLGVSYDPVWLARLSLALRGSNARLVVAGEGAGEAAARALLAEAGENPSHTFLGRLSREAVFELGAAADIAVSSLIDVDELKHNSLNKVFDAFALGRPVVFNHDGWLSELAVQREAGWRWPRDLEAVDVNDMVGSFTEPLLRRASENSIEIGRDMFDRDLLFEEFYRVLQGTPHQP